MHSCVECLLFLKVVETFGGGTWLEEVITGGMALKVTSGLCSLPVSVLPGCHELNSSALSCSSTMTD
jgi:hypothetical protein